MPLHWTFSHPQRLVIALARGSVGADEIDSYTAALTREDALGYRKIFDITHAPQSLTAHAIAGLGPLAIVAASDESYREARRLAAGAVALQPITLFREMHAARRWLDGAALPEARDPQPPPFDPSFRDDSSDGGA